jgi:hypothetical protein
LQCRQPGFDNDGAVLRHAAKAKWAMVMTGTDDESRRTAATRAAQSGSECPLLIDRYITARAEIR